MIVRHSKGQYPVDLRPLADAFPDPSFVVTDSNVRMAWGRAIEHLPVFEVEPGETSKSPATYQLALEWLADHGAKRSSTLIAFGGGVVGDLGGFVAATYMRGINLVQVPTTLLAMVDSSVGGKVGIDLPQGKNLVGAFYPPRSVALCMEALSTLPLEQLNNGAAEVWKYGAILDWALFESLENQPLEPGDARTDSIVQRCIQLKARVVEEDEFEETGRRAILNFGHTVGHALEKASGYEMLHGHAIAMGMVVEARIGQKLGLTPAELPGRLKAGLRAQGLPTTLGEQDAATLVDSMRLDKKAGRAGLAFALLTGYGSCKLMSSVSEAIVLECLQESL